MEKVKDMEFEEVYERYHKMVRMIAKKRLPATEGRGFQFDDLMQEGLLALAQAHQKYDDSKGSFSTFAYSYINGFITTFLNSNMSIAKVPKHHAAIWKRMDEWEDEHGSIDPVEFAKVYGHHVDFVKSMISNKVKRQYFSIDKMMNNKGGQSKPAHEMIGEYSDFSDVIVDDFYYSLTDRQKIVIDMTLSGYRQKHIAERVGVCVGVIKKEMQAIRTAGKRYFIEKVVD